MSTLRIASALTLKLTLSASVVACGSPRLTPRSHEGEAPKAPVARIDTEVSCVGCHPTEAAEWERSMHHASFSSADFQASWRAEPLGFCADCHAPERKHLGEVGEQRGVGCGWCHTLGERHGTPGAQKGATSSCTPCHDFPAPNSNAFLQSTAREHAQGKYASTPCATCHMPQKGAARDHTFDSSRNRERLQHAVEISSVLRKRGPTGKNEVAVTLHTVGVGHFFPTGDIFRRLTMGVVATNAQGELVCTETFHFNRNWGAHAASMRTGAIERFEDDSRLTDAPRTLRIPCEGDPRDVEVSLTYTRGRAANASFFEAFDSLELRREHFAVALQP